MKISCPFYFDMKSWVLTGGIACGKSLVAEILKVSMGLRLSLFSADQTVSRLLDAADMALTISELFGASAVIQDGQGAQVNKPWLRQKVFEDVEARKLLEGILHPKVLADLEMSRNSAEAEGSELFLAEVPLHYEIGSTVTADLIIVAASSRTMQVRRLMERRGLEESIIEQMLRSQWPIEAKVERADVVIWNDGDTAALEAQVLTLARQIWNDESYRKL